MGLGLAGRLRISAIGHTARMVIGGVIVACVVLFILALLVPRLSRGPQKGVGQVLGIGARAGGKAPGPIGLFLSKSFSKSRKATNKSAEAGRRTRGKLPL